MNRKETDPLSSLNQSKVTDNSDLFAEKQSPPKKHSIS